MRSVLVHSLFHLYQDSQDLKVSQEAYAVSCPFIKSGLILIQTKTKPCFFSHLASRISHLLLVTFLLFTFPALAQIEPIDQQPINQKPKKNKFKNWDKYWKPYATPRFSNLSVEPMLGGSYYLGDISTMFAIGAQWYTLSPSFSLSASYRFTDFVSVRANLSQFRLGVIASGAWSGRDFVSGNQEFSVQAIHDFVPRRELEHLHKRWGGYFFLGAGAVRYAPTNTLPLASLDSLGRNPIRGGQVTLCLPVGAAVTYQLLEEINIGFELGYRFTFSDFMDDASVGGSFPFGTDGYYIYGFRASMMLYDRWKYGRYLKSK